MNSMVAFGSLSIIGPLLGWLAGVMSNQVAMVSAGAFSVIGALFYLPALRAERKRAELAVAQSSAASASA
jgi:hypothetical protein